MGLSLEVCPADVPKAVGQSVAADRLESHLTTQRPLSRESGAELCGSSFFYFHTFPLTRSAGGRVEARFGVAFNRTPLDNRDLEHFQVLQAILEEWVRIPGGELTFNDGHGLRMHRRTWGEKRRIEGKTVDPKLWLQV